jgi:hypothetical protein
MRRAPRAVLPFVVLATALSAGACDVVTLPGSVVRGSGVVVEQDRNARGVAAVHLAAPGELRIVQGPAEEFWIQAEDNLIRHLVTRVDGRTLRIEIDHGVVLHPTRPIRYNLVVRDLERLVLSASGSAEVFDFSVPSLEVAVSGSGGLTLDGLYADAIVATLSGSGALDASGSVREQRLALSGSGPFRGRHLNSRRAEVRTSGSGSATVRVRDRLDAWVSGSGSVLYYGNPQVGRSVTGSGDVRRLGS